MTYTDNTHTKENTPCNTKPAATSHTHTCRQLSKAKASGQATRGSGSPQMPRRLDNPTYKKNRAQLLRDKPACHWCKKAPGTQADHIIEHDRGDPGKRDVANEPPQHDPGRLDKKPSIPAYL